MPRFTAPLRLSGLLLLAAACCGQVPARHVDGASVEYFARTWSVDNGLPHNVVNALVQDSQKFLWLATWSGLARFDGYTFKEFPLPGLSRSLDAGYNIRAVAMEDSETILFLPASDGIWRLRKGEFSQHPASAAVPAGLRLVDLFVEPDGTIWAGAASGPVIRWSAGQLNVFGPAEGYGRRSMVTTFARDSDGRTWVASGDTLRSYCRDQLEPPLDPELQTVMIAPARDGGVWVSSTRGLAKLQHGQLTALCAPPEWPHSSNVQHLFEGADGTLWVATRRHGLYKFSAGALQSVPTPHIYVSSVCEDAEGNLWACANGSGISRLQRKAFVLLGSSTGLPDPTSTAVCTDPSGAVWCANRTGGVVRYFNGKTEVFTVPPGSPELFATTVYPHSDGYLWIGARNGVARLSLAHPHLPIERMPESLRGVYLLYSSPAGDLWVASSNNTAGFYRNGKYKALSPEDGFNQKAVNAITADPSGRVWLAIEQELFEVVDDKLVRRTVKEEFPGGRIHSMYIDPAGVFWLATPTGLVIRRTEKYYRITQAHGLPDDLITQVLEDNQGQLWMGGRLGFFHAAKDDLLAAADGRLAEVTAITFGHDNGFSQASPLTGRSQPICWKAPDGRVWFCTFRGVVGIDPSALPVSRTPPEVLIDEVLIDQKPAPFASTLRVPPFDRRVDIRFTAPTYLAPERVAFRHRLIGFDRDWVETNRERTASYTRLPPGKYTLLATARHEAGRWSEHAAQQAVIVLPAWWQTWSFRAAALLGFTSLVVWIARIWALRSFKARMRRLEQEHALEKERARISRDLHDELGGSLTQIGLLAERLKRRSVEPDLADPLSQLVGRTQRLIGDLESIVWTVSPKNNSLDRLALFLRRFAQRFFKDTSILCSVDGVENIPPHPLGPDVQYHLLAIAKEALNNVLKHSRATRVTVNVSFATGIFTLSLQDDGVGFSPGAVEHAERNGLNNMHARAKEIGADLQIVSAPGKTTTLTLQVRLTPEPANAEI